MNELIVGHTYEAKRPRINGGLVNDRMIVWANWEFVQYDSPTIRTGQKLPKVRKDVFSAWAGRDVTEIMPKGEWRGSLEASNARD